MYQVPLARDTYTEDNKKVYLKLKEYLVETKGWAWIKTFDRSQDVEQPINHGQIIIMGQANLISILNMPKPNLTHFITKMKGLFHSNSSQERSNSVLQ